MGAGSISCFRSAARARRAGNPVVVGSRWGRLRRSCPRRSCARRSCPRRCCARRSCPRHPSPLTPLVTTGSLPDSLRKSHDSLAFDCVTKTYEILLLVPRTGVRRKFHLALMSLRKFLELVNLNADLLSSGRFPTPPHVGNGCAKASNTRARQESITGQC